MKAILAIVSLLLTAAAIVLTGKVMKPPAPIQDKESKEDPQPVVSTRIAAPSASSAAVAASDVERFYRQNLFHPSREWVDPDNIPPAGPVDGKTEDPPEMPTDSDADNFELIGIFRVGDRATAVIKVLPPKPKPVVRTRSTSSRGIPIRSSRTPAPPTKKVESTTHVYALGKPIEETGYTLSKVELESVELTRDADDSIITLELDKFDDGSKERRKGAQTAAVAKAKTAQAKVTAAQRAAQAKAKAGAASAKPGTTPRPPTPKPTSSSKAPTKPGTQTTAEQSAADRAKRLEEIREQFRKRLEERRSSSSSK